MRISDLSSDVCSSDLPPDLQQLLIFELIEVPVGVPQARLLELTTILKRYSRSVLLRLPLTDPVFRPANETGINIVGASLSELRLRERQVMRAFRSEEHTSELQSLMRISYAVFCLKKKNSKDNHTQ